MLPDLIDAPPKPVLVAEGCRQGVPWCAWCNTPVTEPAGHRPCLRALQRTSWCVCQACCGGGIDNVGNPCCVCHGVGFIADGDLTAREHAQALGLVDEVKW